MHNVLLSSWCISTDTKNAKLNDVIQVTDSFLHILKWTECFWTSKYKLGFWTAIIFELQSSVTCKFIKSPSAEISSTGWVFVYSSLYPSCSNFLFPPCLHLPRSDLSSISLLVSAVEAGELSHYLCIGIIGIHVCAWDRAHPEQGPGPRHDKQGVSKSPRDPLICRQPTGILTYARLIFLYIKQP